MVRVGIILSGAGVCDGSEIHESVLTLLALDRAGAQAIFMAPNKNQGEVINHLTGQIMRERRNVLVESARIARGQIRDLSQVHASDLDAVILPGGYGAVKNLSNFCWAGDQCWIDGDVSRLLREMAAARKPIGALCIAPAILAKVFGSETPRLTIGTDEMTAAALGRLGAQPVSAQVDEIVTDENLNLISTPAYMLAGSISQAAEGISRLVDAVVRRAKKAAADSAAARIVSKAKKAQAADSAVAKLPAKARSKAARITRSSSRAARPTTRRRTAIGA